VGKKVIRREVLESFFGKEHNISFYFMKKGKGFSKFKPRAYSLESSYR